MSGNNNVPIILALALGSGLTGSAITVSALAATGNLTPTATHDLQRQVDELQKTVCAMKAKTDSLTFRSNNGHWDVTATTPLAEPTCG